AEDPAPAVPPVGVDRSGPEVRDEQVAAETAEPVRRKRNAPRLVELPLASDTGDEPPSQVELGDIAPGRRIVAVHRRAPRIRDENAVADRLDPERRVPDRNCRVGKRAVTHDRPPL